MHSRSVLEAFTHTHRHALQRGHQRGAILAATLRHVGAATALAIDLPGHLAQHIAGLDPAKRRAVMIGWTGCLRSRMVGNV